MSAEDALSTPTDKIKYDNAKKIRYNGQTKTISEWSMETGLPCYLIYKRIESGWDTEKVLTTKHKKYKKRGRC